MGINEMRQNKPSLIARDLARYCGTERVYEVLFNRGVFKWFAARRDLIRLKDEWRKRIVSTIEQIRSSKRTVSLAPTAKSSHARLHWLRGYLHGVDECRREVRAICHSSRDRVQDNDSAARAWWSRSRECSEFTLADYDHEVDALWGFYNKDVPVLAYVTIALAEEAGEFAGKVKKMYRDGRDLDDAEKERMAFELGDLLFYLTKATHVLDRDLRRVAEANVEKLRDRGRRGVLFVGEGDAR